MVTNQNISPHVANVLRSEKLNMLQVHIGMLPFPQWFQKALCEVGMMG